MDGPRVLVAGQIARDLVVQVPDLPGAGRAADATGRLEQLGGKGANQAVAAAQLGAEVGLLGVVGADETGERLLAQARRDAIDVAPVVRRAGVPTALVVEVLQPDGTWRYLQHMPPGTLLTTDDVAAAAPRLRQADVVSVQLQQPADAALAAVQQARAGGALVVCDGVPAPGDGGRALLAGTDVLRADAHEAQLLLELDDDDPAAVRDAAGDLLAAGPRLVALGVAGGDLFVWEGGSALVPHPGGAVVDTTGAGDAMTAALAVGVGRGDAPEAVARLAAAAATVVVGRAGGRPALTRAALRRAAAAVHLDG